jgi:hypothetical protein
MIEEKQAEFEFLKIDFIAHHLNELIRQKIVLALPSGITAWAFLELLIHHFLLVEVQ